MRKQHAIVILGAALLGCPPDEVREEVTNRIACGQLCDWSVDCGRSQLSKDACEDDCEDKADANDDFRREVEDCSECIDNDDLTCQQNEEICSDECDIAAPVTSD
jgi:hypothetical protein